MIEVIIFPLIAVTLSAIFYTLVGEKSDRALCACTATMFSAVGTGLSLVMMLEFFPITQGSVSALFVLSGCSALITSLILKDIKQMVPVTQHICLSLLLSLTQCIVVIIMFVFIQSEKSLSFAFVIFVVSAVTTIIQTLIVRHIHWNPVIPAANRR